MGESLGSFRRSGMCADLTEKNAGQQVSLCGWVQRRRDLGKLIFVWLRDYTGIVQIVCQVNCVGRIDNAVTVDIGNHARHSVG